MRAGIPGIPGRVLCEFFSGNTLSVRSHFKVVVGLQWDSGTTPPSVCPRLTLRPSSPNISLGVIMQEKRGWNYSQSQPQLSLSVSTLLCSFSSLLPHLHLFSPSNLSEVFSKEGWVSPDSFAIEHTTEKWIQCELRTLHSYSSKTFHFLSPSVNVIDI